LADNYPNSGSLTKALNGFDNNLQNTLIMKDKNLLCIRRNARKEIAKHFQLKKQSQELVIQIIVLNIEANIEYILGFFKAMLVKILTNSCDCFFN
jgi:hypothetical protein